MSQEKAESRGSFDPGGETEHRSLSPIELDPQRLLTANTLHESQRVDPDDGRIDSINLNLESDLWSSPSPLSISTMDQHAAPLQNNNGKKYDKSNAGGSGYIRPVDFDQLTIKSATDSGVVCTSKQSIDSDCDSLLTKHTEEDSGFESRSIKASIDSSADNLTSDSILDGTPILRLDGAEVQWPDSDATSHTSDHGYFGSVQSADFSSFGSFASADDSHVLRREKFGSVRPSERPSSVNSISTSKQKPELRQAGSWHAVSDRRKLQDFAEKMNFTEAEFEQAMLELGEDSVDCDTLLRSLVKLRDSSRVAPPSKAPPKKTKRPSASKPSARSVGDSKGLRGVVIDGSNVAMEHGLHQIYSCRGIELVVQYFQRRGHECITVFVPAHRLRTEQHQTRDQHILNKLSRMGVVVKTPSRKSSKGNIASYEDRFILKLASIDEAIVVSNDQFRDLKSESSAFRETIEKRILPFVFANDQFIPAEDPLGKRGPTLEQFLRVDPYNTTSGACPYGRKCTYGTKCKYGHPEREVSRDSALGESFKSGFASSGKSSSMDSAAGPPPQPEYWTSRMFPFEHQYPMGGVPVTARYLPPQTVYPQYMMSGGSGASAHNAVLPTNYYLPITNPQFHGGQAGGGYAADYPPVRIAYPPLASRACLHVTKDESYLSVPLDDAHYRSRQPSSASNHTSAESFLPNSDISSSAPQPLNEHISTTSSQYPTNMIEGRLQRPHPLDAPILNTDPRYNMYFHLKNLFNEKIVRRVMNRHPKETDPNKITSAVLLEQQSKKGGL